ncbi:MAG TPA: hypothetical protein VGK25_11115, partial [Ignavibacteria bacterium]
GPVTFPLTRNWAITIEERRRKDAKKSNCFLAFIKQAAKFLIKHSILVRKFTFVIIEKVCQALRLTLQYLALFINISNNVHCCISNCLRVQRRAPIKVPLKLTIAI